MVIDRPLTACTPLTEPQFILRRLEKMTDFPIFSEGGQQVGTLVARHQLGATHEFRAFVL
jgi:hypothetical protein